MSKVALIRCESYDPESVRDAVQRGLDLLGGPATFMRAGERIVLKLNWLATAKPEDAATTHPAVFRAVAQVLSQTGAKLSYGDSPGVQSPEWVGRKSGCLAVGEELGLPLDDFVTEVEVHHPGGVQNRKFTVAKAVAECDGLVSLPKLKAHGFMKYTGCIKNQFGCVPGALKGEFHVKLPGARDFARMLVDLNNWVHPRLYVMDGILAMEGNGPMSGTPRKMNLLAFSTDPVALDATMCRILEVDPALVPTTVFGMESGAGTWKAEEIELLGDPLESFVQANFAIKRDALPVYQPKGWLRSINNALVPKPFILPQNCTRCGTCIRACPVKPKALDWHDGDKAKLPSYRYERCIRCYCCQELCPEKAIELKVPLLRRLTGYRQ